MQSADTNIFISYMALRKLIGYLGLLLPVLVVAGGELVLPYRTLDSISGYYYSNMRDPFVGLLCIVGIFLCSYKGYDRRDSIISGTSGVLAIMVALFPTRNGDEPPAPVGIFQWSDTSTKYIHYACALTLFFLLASMSMFLFTKTDPSVPLTKEKLERNKVYRICGGIMFAALACGGILSIPGLENAAPKHLVLVVEWVCLWAFGTSWIVKGEAILGDHQIAAGTAALD
jgi:hypothetical protein